MASRTGERATGGAGCTLTGGHRAVRCGVPASTRSAATTAPLSRDRQARCAPRVEAARQAGGVVALLPQPLGDLPGALAALADGHELAFAGQLGKASGDVVHGDVHRTLDAALGLQLLWLADVEHRWPGVAGQLAGQLLWIDLRRLHAISSVYAGRVRAWRT